jgi:hypothetical protein
VCGYEIEAQHLKAVRQLTALTGWSDPITKAWFLFRIGLFLLKDCVFNGSRRADESTGPIGRALQLVAEHGTPEVLAVDTLQVYLECAAMDRYLVVRPALKRIRAHLRYLFDDEQLQMWWDFLRTATRPLSGVPVIDRGMAVPCRPLLFRGKAATGALRTFREGREMPRFI